MALDLAEANFIGVVLELMLFGAYAMLFIQHMQLLLRRRPANPSSAYIYLMATSIVLFVFVGMRAFVDLERAYKAFAANMSVPNAPMTFYASDRGVANKLHTVFWLVPMWASDLFLVYRCWVVWQRRYLVAIVPFLLFLSTVGLGIAVIMTIKLTNFNGASKPSNHDGTVAKYYLALALAESVICTALISYKIWSVQQGLNKQQIGTISQSSGSGRGIFTYSRLYGTIVIMIESAAIYCTVLVECHRKSDIFHFFKY